MKNTVIKFFQNLPENKAEQFNKAFELYRQSPGKSESAERVLNASGYSDSNLNNLLYDLQKMHGITDIEKLPAARPAETSESHSEFLYKKIVGLSKPEFLLWLGQIEIAGLTISDFIEEANKKKDNLTLNALIEIEIFAGQIKSLNYLTETPLEEILKVHGGDPRFPESLDILLELANSQERLETISKIVEIIAAVKNPDSKDHVLALENQDLKNQNQDLTTENEDLTIQNEDLQDENEDLQNENNALKLKQALSEALPKISAESLRSEYPFLNEKDCPNELKILVSDKITAWNEYLTLHDEALKAEAGEIKLSKEDLDAKSKRAVECFEENQRIHDELNAYKETGKLLGKHPIFRTLRLTREVEEMTQEELFNYKNSTAKFFSDNKKKLEKEKDPVKIELIKEKVANRTEKLELVDKKLGIKK